MQRPLKGNKLKFQCILGFSRGGRISKKKFENFDLFFQVDHTDFRSFPKAKIKTLFTPNFLRRRHNFEKTGQKSRFWAVFGEV